MTAKYSDNIKDKILEIISKKVDDLTQKSYHILTDNFKNKLPHFDRSNIGSICGNLPTNKTTPNNEVLDSEIERFCKVTNLDISMQKKGSKFLSFAGLEYYKENDPETYKMIEQKYLTAKMKTRPIKKQLYYIAHNIRNEKTNPNHNPKYSRQRFEQRYYPKHQLQINFID